MFRHLMLPVAFCLATAAPAQEWQLTDGTSVAPLDPFRECEGCPEMIALPLASFTMGAPPEQSAGMEWTADPAVNPLRARLTEGPVHEVEIDLPIAMGRNEVTVGEWALCVPEGGCSHDPGRDFRWAGAAIVLTDRHPVVDISWNDMQEYIAWLNARVGADVYRLPTEAEWEYAARAGTGTVFAQGDTLRPDQARFFTSIDQVEPALPASVDALDAANPWGLRHMSGNVRERTLSCWTDRHMLLPRSALHLIAAESIEDCRRVSKGGNFAFGSIFARPGVRGHSGQDTSSSLAGFRLVRALDSQVP
jgi:formylglycine-generating enzyme required for sulfatase activity